MAEIDAPHLRGIIVIPPIIFFRCYGVGSLDALGHRLNKLILKRGSASGRSARFQDMVAAELGGDVGLLLAVLMPGEIVERTRGISHTPMCHDALRIDFERLAEAFDRLLPVE